MNANPINVFSDQSKACLYSNIDSEDNSIFALDFSIKVEETLKSIDYCSVRHFFMTINDHLSRRDIVKLEGDIVIGNVVSFSYLDIMHDGALVIFIDFFVRKETEFFLRKWKEHGAYITHVKEYNKSIKLTLN